MNFQIFLGKIKTKLLLFLVITFLCLTLVFPGVTKSQDINNYNKTPFLIQDCTDRDQDYTDRDQCHEDLIVKLDDRKLFCVVDTEKELPNKRHLKYWQEEAKILAEEAQNYSTSIQRFANKYTKENKIKPDWDKINLDEKNLLKESQRKNYYYLPIFYKESSEYFDDTYDEEIIRIGRHSALSIDKEWETYKKDWKTQGEKVRNKIKKEIIDYRKSFKLAKQEEQGDNNGQEDNNGNEQELEKIELTNQAVRIGGTPIFYIRTWSNGLSPTERAEKVSEKIEKIVKGKIDIQGLGIFEKLIENTEIEDTEDEKTIIQKPKIIKIISDSKFLSEADKEIIEVTDNDALFEGKDNAADLAQDYLIKINKSVVKYKNLIEEPNQRGYPVKFLKKPIFFINSGSGFFEPSYRASLISKRIEEFAQKNLFLKSDRLVAAYPVGKRLNSKDDKNKGLCILPGSLKPEDYNKFLANNNPNDRNTNDCKIETLEKNNNLVLVYSDEISRKINRGDWQLTDLPIKEKPGKHLDKGLPKTIIFMKLDKDKDYEDLMNIQVDELDSFLHKSIETKQDLAIDFLNQIDNTVKSYRNKKRMGLIILFVLLLIILQIFFRISPKSIKKLFSRKNNFFRYTKRHLHNFLFKTIKLFHYNNDKIIPLFLKVFILVVIIILILSNIPGYDIDLIDKREIFSRFIKDQFNIIWAYFYTQIPRIVFILIPVIILERLFTKYTSRRIEKAEITLKKTKITLKKAETSLELEKAENNLEKAETILVRSKPNLIIFRIAIGIIAIIFIAPHLPTAGTIYFQGISAFVVLAFTWSASNVITDLVAGILLIYSKSPLKKKDWVKVGDTIGEIIEQNLLFHKIKTAKNCIITIPNSDILHNFTTNFSASSKRKSKLILHTLVGLGYDLPRKEVEMTLIAAAINTDNILKDDKHIPFVRITNLGDFAVTYELNVYTENPEKIPQIYSDLQKNIQDECNSRGIEILSPSYLALRDGGDSTIPEEYNKPKLFGLERWWRSNNSK